jgi:UDP-N-acetylglucosamine 2-epimerase (non-hydrolysing)/GDP/UDP-N,N'-diacetylbacillosamine 2-epimerase (hydrolysing)
MAKTIGVAVLGLAEVVDRLRPDLLLLIADRYEMLAPAAVATALRIPIAHIEGGEVSEGAIDEAVRNALTKLSHIHFTPTETATRRVLSMGEEAWRVHQTGAPSLDHLVRSELLDRPALASALGGDVPEGSLLVSYHPVTIATDTLRETDELFAALEALDAPTLFCFPNADTGSRRLAGRVRALCERLTHGRLFVNLNPVTYWSLLRSVSAMAGNSSSGIMESPALELPAVNVGLRQQGRERARNVIDAPPEREAILAAVGRALDPGFRRSLRGMRNPYGDGHAAGRVVRVLAGIPLGEVLLRKAPVPLRGGGPTAGPDAAP